MMEAETELQQAADFFDLGYIKDSKGTPFGIGNENYFVTTDKGEFVIRRLWEQTLEGLQNEIAIQNQLENAGMPIAKLLKGKDGKLYYSSDTQAITGSKKIEGEHPFIIDEDLSKRLGELLAKYHQAVKDLPVKTKQWLNPDYSLTLLNKITNNLQKEDIDQRLKQNLDLFNLSLPKGIIHGDLYSGNILITSDDQLVIFDFETAEKSLLILDIARSLLDIPFEESFLEGYESIRKLTELEKSNLQKAKLYVSAAVAAWLIDHDQPDGAKEMLQKVYVS